MRSRRALRMLLVPLLSLAVLLGLSGCSLNPFAGGSMTVVAYFTDTAGVFVGNDVGVLGVPVGKITSITPAGTQVKVTMSVNSDQPIPAGAAAVVVPRSVATDRYIELTPAYTGGPKMATGAVIPVDRTQVPVEFDEVLGALGKLANGLGGSKQTSGAIRRALDTLATTLNGHGPLINQTIHSLSKATTGLAGQRGNATSSLVALDQLTKTLATNQATVTNFLQQVANASSILASERGNFQTSLRQVTKMIRVVAAFAQRNRADINATVKNTDAVLGNVLSQKGAVAEILRDMPLTLQNLERAMGPNGLRVRLDLISALPVLSGVLPTLCKALPANLCTSLGLDPNNLLTILQGLLGGKP